MQPLGQRLIPLSMNTDLSNVYLKSDMAFFLKGLETSWQGAGANEAELHPSESNYLYASVSLPEGINTTIGYEYHAEENTGYVVVHNSLGDHLIYRLKGNNNTAEIVYRFCRNFPGIVNEPEFYFSTGRIVIKSICRFLPDGTQEGYKEMLLVNKKVNNLRIVVEDSIATNSFTTQFFTPKDICCGDPCRIIQVGVPTPMAEIKAVPIAATDADALVQNRMVNQMFQWRFVYENAWGQRSEHGLISDAYFANLSGCSGDVSGTSHCVWLETKTPCPEIVKITVEKRTCVTSSNGSIDGNVLSAWSESFTINLYDQSNPALRWYQRIYDVSNKDFEFFNNGKNIRIKFCNDRECKTIAPADLRNQNPAPINSGTVGPIGKGLAYGDNENNLEKFSKEDIKSIKLSLEKTGSCTPKYSRIVVWAVIHNYDHNFHEFIYTQQGIVGFGGYLGAYYNEGIRTFEPMQGFTTNGGYGQKFPTGVKGFRAVLAGTPHQAESVQYAWTPTGGFEKIDALTMDESELKNFVNGIGANKKVLVQKFDFGLVPCDYHLFRICGHDDIEGKELVDTSTFYRETSLWSMYKSSWGTLGWANQQKEILINTTNGLDYDSITNEDKIAVIQDNTYPPNNAFAVMGYIYESKETMRPMELLEMHKTRDEDFVIGYTDHNGFFWWTTQYGKDYRIQAKGYYRCEANKMLAQTAIKKNRGTTLSPDLFVTTLWPTYVEDNCNRYFITGKVGECGTGGGISNVAVILGRSKPTYTNSKGEFKLLAHYAPGRGNDDLILGMGGSCVVLNCNCGPIATKIITTQPSCINCDESSIAIGTFSLKTSSSKGQPHGARQQIGMSGKDWLGRETPIQTDESLFVDFPTEQEQGDATYQRLKVTLPAKFTADICKRFKNITFYWSINTNYQDWIEWAADEVQFEDNAGNENTSNPTRIKIWWRSLTQYNIARGLNTNTTWAFKNSVLAPDGKTQVLDGDGKPIYSPRVGDIVEFIQNADGKYLPPNTTGTVQYDLDGSYFFVEYDARFKDISDGVRFKIRRPYECEINKTFFEYSFPINFCKNDCVPRDDRGNVVTEFYLDGFSSYSIPRQIPVITDVIITPASPGVEEVKETKKVTKLYPFSFEHHSPSDMWGDHCHNGGRVNYVNPYEGKKCDTTQILLTGALNQANDGAINYLHYFNLADEYVLDEQGFGRIIAILCRDDQQVLVVCELTCFSFRFNDNRAVVTQDGYIAVPTNNRFSKPERNPYFNFGCQPKDINTIRRHDSMVTFLDSHKQALVIHNFSEAVDISRGIQSWLVPSIKEVKSNNAKYWHSAFDFRLKEILFTKFNIADKNYVNQEIETRIDLNETMAYNYETKQWRQKHFTPEYFGNMFGDTKDTQFFCFKNGLAYAHHNAVNPSSVYLNYFGIQCFPVFGIVTNEGGTIEKSFLSNEVYCREILFILERLKTSMGQESQVYESEWEFGAGMSSAPYLCDTQNKDECSDRQVDLFDGDTLYGKWLKGLYIPEPGYKGQYFLLTSIISYFFNRR